MRPVRRLIRLIRGPSHAQLEASREQGLDRVLGDCARIVDVVAELDGRELGPDDRHVVEKARSAAVWCLSSDCAAASVAFAELATGERLDHGLRSAVFAAADAVAGVSPSCDRHAVAVASQPDGAGCEACTAAAQALPEDIRVVVEAYLCGYIDAGGDPELCLSGGVGWCDELEAVAASANEISDHLQAVRRVERRG